MSVDTEKAIIQELEEREKLNFGELKSETGHRGHDVRRALTHLLRNDDRVYVEGVRDKSKLYALREE